MTNRAIKPGRSTRPRALVIFFIYLKQIAMRRIIICAILLAFSTASFSQYRLTKNEYLQKAERQKKTGFILVCSGVLLNVSGAIAYQKGNAGIILFGAGLLADVASLPFFISAGMNKRKAMNAAAFFKLEQTNNIRGMAISQAVYPAISFKLNL